MVTDNFALFQRQSSYEVYNFTFGEILDQNNLYLYDSGISGFSGYGPNDY